MNSANTFILGIGTGLGQAIEYIRPCHSIPHTMTSEFSHSGCPVKNLFDFRYQCAHKSYYNLDYKSTVSFDHVLSSNNLPFLYKYLKSIYSTSLAEEKRK